MDARERRRKAERRAEAREKRLVEEQRRLAEPTVRPALKKGQRYTGKTVIFKAQTPAQYSREIAVKQKKYDAELNAALAKFDAKNRQRLHAAVATPLEHINPLVGPSRNDSPVRKTGSSKKGKLLAKLFQEEKPRRGERVARTEPRKKTSTKTRNRKDEPPKQESRNSRAITEHCKERPKNNRSKRKGGGSRGFIPWCT